MAAKEFIWLTLLLENLLQPMSLYCDKLSIIRLDENPIFSCEDKTFWSTLSLHLRKGHVRRYHTDINQTEDQVTYIFIKGLNYPTFDKHWKTLEIIRRSILKESQCWGGVLKDNTDSLKESKETNPLNYCRKIKK